MTERVDFSCFLPMLADPSMPGPSADLEIMATLLKKELEQMEDYFLEESLSPGVPMPPDQVAPSTPPSHEVHFLFQTPDQQLSGRGVEFPAYITEIPAPAPVALNTLDSGCRLPRTTALPSPAPAPPSYTNQKVTANRRRETRTRQQRSATARQRKRAEFDALDEECQCLEVRNRELKEKSDSIEREIQYVKDLLIEVYKARSQRLRNN
ncbi:unnamed protein product [Staurois parvus]|uniref:BZIP domain-containing protein n=1 Tax=Staurois parvus TaxID=386267 RepID=A0ABN9FJE6_9NEOB|nr:unnamed protein product [Staurois parvus]